MKTYLLHAMAFICIILLALKVADLNDKISQYDKEFEQAERLILSQIYKKDAQLLIINSFPANSEPRRSMTDSLLKDIEYYRQYKKANYEIQ